MLPWQRLSRLRHQCQEVHFVNKIRDHHLDLTDVESNRLDTVQAWLSQVHDYASHKDSEPHFTQDMDDDYTPNWKPHNISVVPISRNYHQFRHSGNRALDQRLTSPKSGLLENDTYSELQQEPSLDIGSNKENGKRSRSRFTQDSHEDRSNKRLFERQPRRKTRPDRYTSKDAGVKRDPTTESEEKRDPTTESEEKRPRKKSRSKKQEIRASRDIMNNFASGAIPNTRVTMRPNLTAGLFLNGRSSTYGRETTQASGYETPEAMLKRLIETGIFDGTGIASSDLQHLYTSSTSKSANVENNESQSKGLFVRRGLQSHDNMIPISGSPGFQHACRPLNGHISSAGLDSAVFPTVHSETYSDHREIQHDNRQLTQPGYCEDGETIHEFIKRIEGEVSMKWDNSQQSVGVGCINDIEECAKSESFEMDNNEDLSQCSDIEHDAAIQSSLHGIFSSSDQGSVSANQAMAEDWEHSGYEQSRYWTGKYYDEHGVSDAKMVGFWRPNHF
ncbi:hypothetical protein FOC4_g10014895 [Fusarium odoratissimum]|uniref:Uncharacterized protein n=1 Tax=Fusarium oxysporum f. sp. cubense (strain race 4) TaxID=2502994 RepID=N1RI30_FUSC4|nr:hypothetical protein FOC4_g10014895 [Fusarium odoratissimum]